MTPTMAKATTQIGHTGARSERLICLVNPKFRATELSPRTPVSVIPFLKSFGANGEIAFERNIPPTSGTATAATCTSEVGLVAAPPTAPCGQVQKRKRNNGPQK